MQSNFEFLNKDILTQQYYEKAFWGRSFMLGLRYTKTDGGDCLAQER